VPVQGVAVLVERAFSKAQPKVVGQEGLLTGRVLAGLAAAYVGAINSGAIPVITSAWQVRSRRPIAPHALIWILLLGWCPKGVHARSWTASCRVGR
jgi:hypothetical protein